MKYCIHYFFALVLVLGWTGCVDQDFDEPPSRPISVLEETHTIAELKALHRSGVIKEITDSIIISGRVISDDTEGNFFKQLIIQDETGGIEIRINQSNLQAIYQRNRVVFVKCKGLSIGDYNNFIQLGFGDDGNGGLGRIPENFVDQFIENGEIPANPVEPKEVLISKITPDMYGTLIKLVDVEFSRDDFQQIYSDTSNVNPQTVNRTIEDCLGGEILLRTSGHADFNGELTPFGNGTIVCVATVYITTKQLLIRDIDDVDMPNTPCNRSGTAASQITIKEVRDLFAGGTTLAPDAKFIQGVVISDQSTENVVSQNMFIQDATAGVAVRFNSDHTFPLGEELRIDISGAEFDEYQGLLQVSGIPTSRAMRLGATVQPTPKELTIAEIKADFENLEGSLIKIKGAEFAGSGTFSGGVDVMDASGMILMFTRFSASFAGDFLPTGSVDITAIVSQGGNDEDQQIILRDSDDVDGGSTGGNDPVDAVSVDFEDQTDFEAVAMRNWQNLAQKGNRNWQAKEFSGNLYAQATSFRDMDPEMEAWLITPKLNMDVITTMDFESAMSFYKHDGLTVYISVDYDGSDVNGATWVDLSPRIASEADGDNNWVPSGAVDLSAYNGIAHIAFVHVGNSATNTTSYRLDNIEIK